MSMMGKAGRAAKAIFMGMLAVGMANRNGDQSRPAMRGMASPPTRTNPPAKNRMRAYKDKRSSGFHQVKKRNR